MVGASFANNSASVVSQATTPASTSIAASVAVIALVSEPR